MTRSRACSLVVVLIALSGCGSDSASDEQDSGGAAVDLGSRDIGEISTTDTAEDSTTRDSGSADIADTGNEDVQLEDADADDETTEDVVDEGADIAEDTDMGIPVSLASSMTDETWYQGSTDCSQASLSAESTNPGEVVVTLLQVPSDSVTGTCSGHTPAVTLTGEKIDIEITGSTGSSCWTACWDFEVTITDVPAGTYTVRFGDLSDTVTVS